MVSTHNARCEGVHFGPGARVPVEIVPRRLVGRCAAVLAFLGVLLFSQKPTVWRDPAAHKIQFVTVDKDVRLEVLDWGGSGRPIVFLSGLGATAHIFDEFAPKIA